MTQKLTAKQLDNAGVQGGSNPVVSNAEAAVIMIAPFAKAFFQSLLSFFSSGVSFPRERSWGRGQVFSVETSS